MTRDNIISVAREAGLKVTWGFAHMTSDEIFRFAALVAAAEREACAEIVENADIPDCGGWNAKGIADDIRARGQR